MDYNSSKNQGIKRNFVENQVYGNVSPLVSELANNEKYMDELVEIYIQYDYQSPVERYVENDMSVVECTEWLTLQEGSMPGRGNAKKQLLDMLENENGYFFKGGYQEFADEFNIDPETNEAYEHWIVSDRLADKLEAKGEMVIKNFYGLTIWGRTTTGQAILLDSVISEICEDMGILNDQGNDNH